MEGFEYVVRKQEKQRVCFGSGCERVTTRKGANTFMRYYLPDDYQNIAPTSYNTMESFDAITKKPCSRSISTKGYGGIARFGSRIRSMEDYPSPFDYDVPTFPRPVNEARHAFDATSERTTFLAGDNPGPGMYVVSKIEGIAFEHSFGGRKKMQLGVKLKCCNYNVDICKACGKRPVGDYWEDDNKNCLCRPCMTKSLQRKNSKKWDRMLFHKVRNCSNVHSHEGTDAKAWIVHPKAAVRWMCKEAYLSAYLKD